MESKATHGRDKCSFHCKPLFYKTIALSQRIIQGFLIVEFVQMKACSI